MDLIEKLIEMVFRVEDGEKIIVTLNKNGYEIESLEGALSEEMGRRVLADINDIHIPSYFENGSRVELVRINYKRRKEFLFGKPHTNEIIIGEPYIEYENR
jgi:hypothetical protein